MFFLCPHGDFGHYLCLKLPCGKANFGHIMYGEILMNLETIDMEERDETLSKIIMLVEAGIIRIGELRIPHKNGIYTIGDFQVEISRSMSHRKNPEFNFWRTGKKNDLYARLTENRRSFVLFMKGKRIVFEDYAGLKITEHIGKGSYPNFQIEWTGIASDRIKKGTLQFFRTDFSGSEFVNYYYNSSSSGYNPHNNTKKSLTELKLPQDLTKTSNVLDCPIELRIDFDAKKKEILAKSGLEELYREIFALT